MKELLNRYPMLDSCKEDILKAQELFIDCYKNGGKILLCGNGGSCADCDHIVGELMKGFLKKRSLSKETKEKMISNCSQIEESTLCKLQSGLPAIALPSMTALNSAFCNDVNADLVYAQSLMALVKDGDVLIAISTSGNSKNVFNAVTVAKALGITVVSLTGEGGGKLKTLSDVCIRVPETETFKVQELHLPVYHYLCAAVEDFFFYK